MSDHLSKILKSVDAILISSPANIKYLTGYSGFSQTERECFLLLTKDKKYLVTDGRYEEAVGKTVHNFELIVIGAGKFIKEGHELLKRLEKIGIEENNLTLSEYGSLKKHIDKIVPVDLSRIRIIKNRLEIEKIIAACKLGDDAFSHVVRKLRVGITEREVANEIEDFFKQAGAETSFPPIVAFGKNSSMPHHLSGQAKLKQNSIVLLDFGAKKNNYCSDMSRTFFFGNPDAEFKKMHNVVLEAQAKAAASIHPGIKASKVDKIARDYIISHGYPSIIHSVGHGIGIEVHEPPYIGPNSKDLIDKGMVFSIEPGIYLAKRGGIRIEDLFLATETGVKKLTLSPTSLIGL